MLSSQKIAVVGGGLAGLSAAYHLLKNGAQSVDVFESEPRVGGRVCSRRVRGVDVDFGGFLVYPWYKEGWKLFAELGIKQQLTKTPLKGVYYFLTPEIQGVLEHEIPFSKKETLLLWGKSLLKILPRTELSRPDLERFGRTTITEYVRRVLGTTTTPSLYELFFDTVNQGYCYGPIDKTKTAFMAPISREVALHGDIHTTFYFPSGTHVLTDALAQYITTHGGRIHTSTPITDVDGLTCLSNTQSWKFDAIIFAQTVAPDLFQHIAPDVKYECWYTQFLTVVVELSETPLVAQTTEWGAAFYVPEAKRETQLLSAINLPTLYGTSLNNCLTLNIIVRRQESLPVQPETVHTIVRDELARVFPNQTLRNVLEVMHWKKTMPVVEESFVEAIRARHGKNGYFFAGDFLGAPSMETAIATGKQAAEDVFRSLI